MSGLEPWENAGDTPKPNLLEIIIIGIMMLISDLFFRRRFWGCAGVVVTIAGMVIFLLFKYHPFWRYP
jgi:hypothetical protein